MSDTPIDRDLCTLDDVRRYIPGYEPDDETEETLQALIESISVDTYEEIGREFVARGEDGETRLFEIDDYDVEEREVQIGDAAEVTVVEIHDARGTVLQAVPDESWVALPRSRDSWGPITSLAFPIDVAVPAELSLTLLTEGMFYEPGFRGRRRSERLLAVTATWGFPAIPANVRQSIAKLVIVRYLTDVGASGTALTDALDNINIGGLFRSATESLQGYKLVDVG